MAFRELEEYRSKGASVQHPPTHYDRAYEMQIEDPDGNVLRLGSDPKPDQPHGEWLDMRGDRWVRSAAGGWTRIERGSYGRVVIPVNEDTLYERRWDAIYSFPSG